MYNNVFKDIPYAQWLENTLQEMVHLPVKGVCLAATTDNGAIYNSYYNEIWCYGDCQCIINGKFYPH